MARLAQLAILVLCIAFVMMPRSAIAADASTSQAFQDARAAWDRGALEQAETLYRQAIEKGGLSPSETLESYVNLGSARAMLGKKAQALAAFRAAAILDSTFTVPAEAGPRGGALARQAKYDTEKFGSLQLTIDAPKQIPAGKAFVVVAHVDAAHLGIVRGLTAVARDGTSAKSVSVDATPADDVRLTIPAEIALPGASILVRVDARDAHQNRMASAETRVLVSGFVAETGPPPPTPPPPSAPVAVTLTPSPSRPSRDEPPKKKGDFWSSPWPYVIGGVVLAGAGTAVYFVTRPPDEVSVGQVGVRTR